MVLAAFVIDENRGGWISVIEQCVLFVPYLLVCICVAFKAEHWLLNRGRFQFSIRFLFAATIVGALLTLDIKNNGIMQWRVTVLSVEHGLHERWLPWWRYPTKVIMFVGFLTVPYALVFGFIDFIRWVDQRYPPSVGRRDSENQQNDGDRPD